MIAKAIEEQLPEIARDNDGKDVRSTISVTLTLPKSNVHALDMELYNMTPHEYDDEYIPSDNVEVDVLGINFNVVQETKKEH